jgi:tetratricopeptide (TPR) repeat protein
VSYYWVYYALTFFLAYAERNPLFGLAALVFLAVRPWLPDPVVIFKNLSRIGALKRQAKLNLANITARRDLAMAYIDLRWHKSALHWLDEARARAPRDQEVAYLRGVALLRIGDAENALRAFGEAVGINPDAGEPFSSESARGAERTFRRYGEAFLGAAEALERLKRYPQAEEALSVAASYNSSSLEPLVRLARVRRRMDDEVGARSAARDARKTFSQLPGFMKRKQLGWWLKSFLA